MRNLLLEIENHFENTKELTQKEVEILSKVKEKLETFCITTIHRDDIINILPSQNPKDISDEVMENIAKQMKNSYLYSGFHESLLVAVTDNLPEKSNEE